MRCKITATTGPGYIIDIREQPGDATSTFLKDKGWKFTRPNKNSD
jgi:hypothetical protein